MPRHYSRLQNCALTLTIFLIATLGLSALAQQHAAATAPKSAAQHKRSAAPAQPHPSLSYATYLLNPGDRINALAKGVDGSVYAAGVTVPATGAADVTQPSAGAGNAFVAHFSADGKKLLYFTYLDQSGLDEARAIAVDAKGYAYVTGETKSPAFPVVSAFQASCKTGTSGACAGNAFVAKLDSSGKVVLASYLGGSGEDGGNAIAVDAKGNIYVAGAASSMDFPVTNALQSTAAGKGEAFVAAIAADGSHVLYATYLGGSDADEARGIAVDAQGNAYVTGVTLSLDFPTSGALQAKCAANAKSACAGTAFVSKLSADGSLLVYSTYLGGSGGDAGNAIAVDKDGSACVAGLTNSSDFPVAKASQSALAGGSNAFVSKLSADGSALAFSTYLGGRVSDQANAIAVDRNGNVFVAGWTHSPDFPVKNPVQASCRLDGKHACTVDAFAAQLSASGAKLQFSTFLGGSAMDASRGLAVDTQGSVYLGGWTASRDFPQAYTVQAPGAASSINVKGSSTKATTGSISATTTSTSGGSFIAKITGVTAPATTVTCGSGTNNWTGTAGDGQWTTASNWSTAAVPVSTDNVCIDSTFSATTISVNTISATANQTIASLNSGAPILFQQGPLTITGTSSFADLNMAGGVLTVSGSSTMGTLEDGGGDLSGAGSITVSGLLTWGSGYMCTTYSTATSGCTAPTTQAVTNANGGISFTGSGTLDGRTLNTASGQTVSYTNSYYLYLYDGAIVNNVSGSTWDLANDGNVYASPQGSAGGVFNNAGALTKSSGTSTSNVYPTFNNTGTVTLTAATSDFSGGGDCGSTCAGTWSVATGATLQLDTGTFALSGGISGAGMVNFASGTENLTGSYNVTGGTTVSGGSANFNGSVASVGPLTVSGGVANFTTSSLTTITTPTLTLSGGYLSGPDPITVSGLLTWSSGYMCTTYSTATSGCSAPTTQAVTNANGGISFTGYGSMDGRTLNTATGKTVSYTSSYYLYLYDGAIVNNVSGSTWDLGNDGSLISSPQGSAGGVFNNTGTFKKSSGTSTSNVYPTFNNTGTVTLTAATTDFSGGASGAGTWSVGTGATLQLDTGTFALSGGISGAGTVNFASGTENLSGTYTLTGPTNISNGVVDFAQSSAVTIGGPLNLSGGYMYGPATVSISGLLTWSGGNMCTTYVTNSGCTAPTTQAVTNANGGISFSGYGSLDGRTLNTATGKTVSYTNSYYLNLYDGAVVNNVAGSIWSLANDASVYSSPLGSSGGTFNNVGTLVKSSTTTGTSYIYPQFNNTGSVQANAGTVEFEAFAQTAGSTALGGGTITFTNPTSIQAGTFGGSGTVNGAVITNTGATLAPGTSTTAGAMTIAGGYTQGSGGAMSIKVGGTSSSQFDHVAVSNTVTLGGPLSVTLINGFTPTVGTGFTILTSTSTVNGTFSSVSSGWTVTYNPSSVVVTYQGGGGGAPIASLSATKLAFATQVINTTSKPKTVKITNKGTATLNISNIAISGANATEYAYKTTTCTSAVNPGAYCTISVTFKPADKGTRTATLTISDNSGTGSQTVALTGVGTYVQITPSPIVFPSQLLNTSSAPMTITVKNVSAVNNVNVSSITLAGTKAPEYALNGTCTTILPAGTCTFTLTFTPNALGNQAVTLEAFDDGGGSPQKVAVSGKGTYVTLSPSPLTFGSVTVGTSTSQSVTVTNTGPSTAITVKSVAFIGTNKADFKAALGSTCSSVAPNGGTCTITVTFKPAAKGARSATMNVSDTDLGSPQSDPVSGTGQ